MVHLLQILVAGVITGSVYGAVALGFTLIYNVSDVVNLAQGDFFVVGAMVALGLMQATGMPFWAAALLAVAVVAVLGVILERFVIQPARNAALAILLVLTVGAEMILQGLMLIIFGGNAEGLPAIGSQAVISIGGVKFVQQDFWLFGFLALVSVSLVLVLRRTNLGIAMRATAMSSFGAAVTGINTRAVRLVAFAVSGGLAAAAAIFAAPITFVSYDDGTMLGLKAFVAAVLGSIGNPVGAILGGLGLGLAEALSAGYISSLYSNVIAFVILLIALTIRSLKHGDTVGPSFVVHTTFSRLPRGHWRQGVSVAVVALGCVLPLLLGSGFLASLVILVGLYATVLIGLDLLRGYSGMLSLGHAAFMGIGAYATAILTVKHNWSPLAALLVALPLTVIVAALFATVCVRLSGYNLALATLGFAVIFQGLATGLISLTGGSSGLAVGPFAAFGFTFTSVRSQLYLILTIFGLLYIWAHGVVSRQPGRVMKAVHADELAARSLGIRASRVKLKVFVLSAVIACAMGSLYANFESFASPGQFGVAVSLLLLTMLIIGGEGKLWGGAIGVVVLTVIPQYFSSVSEYELLIQGVLLTGVLLLFPSGAAGGLTEVTNYLWSIISGERRGAGHGDGVTSRRPERVGV